MAKYYRKKYYKGPKDKYSVERTAVVMTTAATAVNGLYQSALSVVPSSSTQGMRKVKHLTAELTCGSAGAVIWWCVAFVPQGYTVNAINSAAGGSFYEPNQFVLAAGVNDPDAGPIRIRTPISRNLNSGDSLWLVVGSTSAETNIHGMIQYAITLQ